jgi:hypothetical protein
MMDAHKKLKAQAILLADATNPAIDRADIMRRLADHRGIARPLANARDAEISAERANGLALIGPRIVRIRSIFGTGCPCSFVLASRNVHAAKTSRMVPDPRELPAVGPALPSPIQRHTNDEAAN